jgi:gliding motility-associated transport system permease protein
MRGMYAVFSKEVANFFVSPIAYVVIFMFVFLSGFFFWSTLSMMSMLSLQATAQPMLAQQINVTAIVIRPLIGNMGVVLLFLIPLITMRLFAEEKKSGTIELLLTYPITDFAALLGKFLAALFLLLVMMGSTLTFPVLLAGLTDPDWGPMITGYLGLMFMGGAFISLGLFVSSLTENQIVSAAISFGAALLFWIVSWVSTFTSGTVGSVIRQFSIIEHLGSFNKGIISLSDISFFVLFMGFFLFMTMRSLETHRWRG